MEPLSTDDEISRQRDLETVRRIRYGLMYLGGSGMLLACFVSYLFPMAAYVWNRFLHFGIFAAIPLVWLLLGISLRTDSPTSRMVTITGLWVTYALGIIGHILYFIFTLIALAIIGSGSDPQSLVNRDFTSNCFIAFFNIIVMVIIAMSITRHLRKKSIMALFT